MSIRRNKRSGLRKKKEAFVHANLKNPEWKQRLKVLFIDLSFRKEPTAKPSFF
jgi:hypothetical protein